MGSSRKRKTSLGKPENNNSSSNSTNHLYPQPQPQICYEGEELARLLSSIERERESARLVDSNLPYKIWLKQQFCIGVNDVTRVLERMPPFSTSECSSQHHLSPNGQTHRRKAPPVELQAILVASDCIPRWLTRHLPSLASSKKVPIIYVKDKKGGSLRLGEIVKLRTAIAVGVKVRGNAINQLIEEILPSKDVNLEKLL